MVLDSDISLLFLAYLTNLDKQISDNSARVQVISKVKKMCNRNHKEAKLNLFPEQMEKNNDRNFWCRNSATKQGEISNLSFQFYV